jgi:uncharacterized protein (TIGR03083 family)
VSVVVEALAREVGSVGKVLHKLTPTQWAAPTRCEPMTVLDLVAHMVRGADRIVEMCSAEPIDDEPEKDAVTYFRYDPDAEGPTIVARAQQVAAETGDGAAMTARWDAGWSKALQIARVTAPDSVRPSVFGTMLLEEYLKTRILEVTVHHLDLDDGIGHEPHPDARALELTGDVLRGLLGTDLRPVGMDDLRFALTGTGRADLTEEERAFLGPLAAGFPLLR